ncbi:MAG: molecular chaperone TorD family protein [Desulfobacteraceae bacterium]|nr:molecular chaperone TorD family protein [Desulfobacteraceae bacterium]MDH3837960.1 molecular chaperone TorD family protein [Desulfobacteraceae bacterium]
METKDLLNHELSRMEAFRLLSECYFLPSPGLSDTLNSLELYLANVSELAAKCVQRMRKDIENGQNFKALKVDFAKLFVGPYQLMAAPYGSVYLDDGRTLMGDSTFDVKNRYREEGLDTAKDFKDAPDHITAELEFMYYLVFKEIEAFSDSDIETVIGFIQKQKCFLESHLLAWVPVFVDNIFENADTPFYQNLAMATQKFLLENYQIVCAVLDSRQFNSEKNVEINSIQAQ